MRVRDATQGRIVVERLEVAETRHSRNRGLIGHAPLREGEALLIRPCRWIQTFRMSFPIDVLYCDKRDRVVASSKDLPPGRIDRPVLAASYVLELAAGSIASSGILVGHQLELLP